MGNPGFGKPREDPAMVEQSLVDCTLGSFRAEQCLCNDLRSVPTQLRLSII